MENSQKANGSDGGHPSLRILDSSGLEIENKDCKNV